MTVMNVTAMSAIAISMILVTFLSAKSYLVINSLAKSIETK